MEEIKKMLIKIKGARAFQVSKASVLSPARTINDNAANKLCYLDPGFDYEVEESFGKEMVRRYPMDIVPQGQINTFVEPAKKEEPKGKKKKA